MEDTRDYDSLTVGDIIDFLISKGLSDEEVSKTKVSVWESIGGSPLSVLSGLSMDAGHRIVIEVED